MGSVHSVQGLTFRRCSSDGQEGNQCRQLILVTLAQSLRPAASSVQPGWMLSTL
jgi:hypothetical protein